MLWNLLERMRNQRNFDKNNTTYLDFSHLSGSSSHGNQMVNPVCV